MLRSKNPLTVKSTVESKFDDTRPHPYSPLEKKTIQTLKENLNRRNLKTQNQKMLEDMLLLAEGKTEELFSNSPLKKVFSGRIDQIKDPFGQKYRIRYPDQFNGYLSNAPANSFLKENLEAEKRYYQAFYTFLTTNTAEGIASLIKQNLTSSTDLTEEQIAKLSRELFSQIQRRAPLLASQIQAFNEQVNPLISFLNNSTDFNKQRIKERDGYFQAFSQALAPQGGGGIGG